MKIRIHVKFLILLPCVILGGCLGPGKINTPSHFTLTTHQKPLPSNNKHLSASLLVATPSASPGYETSSMVYTMIPYKLMTYADNTWVAPPAEMFLPILSSTIRQINVFKSVISSPYAGFSNYTLNTTIETLQQEFYQPVSQIRMVVLASLVDNASQKVIATQRFIAVVAAPGNDAYAGVLATNAAAGQLSDKIALFVRRSV